ncbi:MAG: sugar fermentation stimulation protein A [Alteromonadaceae bacterium]|jgi:sugar fermentation stimulation protein A
MKFSSDLQQARLIKRYKRFLADIRLDNNEIITIHCPNTGAMTGCASENDRVWYSTSSNLKRKYPNTWEVSQNAQDQWFCVNTTQANHIVKEAIEQGQIKALCGYDKLRSEVKYGEENSRIDLLLQDDATDKRVGKADCYIEVKSVTLLGEDGQGYFPDAVSTRGQKHIRELISMIEAGHRAVLFFLVQHEGIKQMSPARHIDLKYTELLEQAIEQGVEVLCYRTNINEKTIVIDQRIGFSMV